MNILQAAIDSLWYFTYGILVGWGASFTLAVVLILILYVKLYRLKKQLSNLANRVVVNEREMNFHIEGTKDRN